MKRLAQIAVVALLLAAQSFYIFQELTFALLAFGLLGGPVILLGVVCYSMRRA